MLFTFLGPALVIVHETSWGRFKCKNSDLKQLGRERYENGCWIFRFPFSCLYNSCVSFLFCLKVSEYEKLEALFLKQQENWNDSCANVHVLYKTQEMRFSHSVSKDDEWKVVRWLHSHVKWLYSVIIKTPSTRSRVLSKTETFFSEYGYHPRVTGVFSHRKRRFSNTLSRVEISDIVLKTEIHHVRVDGRKRRFSNTMTSWLGSRLALLHIQFENATCGRRFLLNTKEKVSVFENTRLHVDKA